jgi:hypothetical protein
LPYKNSESLFLKLYKICILFIEWNPTKNSLIFQQMDLDHYIAPKPIPGMPGAKIGPVPVIRYIENCD